MMNQAALVVEGIVEIEGVSKWYEDFCALDKIQLTIRQGEKVVICGPSGSGKSTLLRCINGLEIFDQGVIKINHIQLDPYQGKSLASIRRIVGMVFQQFNLFPHLTILENLSLAPVLVKKINQKAATDLAMEYLAAVKISEQAQKYPSQLSGGQQQRAAIARSLCMEPKIMLFDEPTSALDPEMINEVLEVILALAQKGMTMLCVTHEMVFAKHIADRIVFMDQGKIIEINPPATFFTTENPRTKQFLQEILPKNNTIR